VITELVEALHHSRGRKVVAYDDARATRRAGEIDAIDRFPVVHRVDQDLAGEQVRRELPEATRGYRQGDDLGMADDPLGRNGTGTRGEDIDGHGDVVFGSGA
jgi:hypothetical protein